MVNSMMLSELDSISERMCTNYLCGGEVGVSVQIVTLKWFLALLPACAMYKMAQVNLCRALAYDKDIIRSP
jgi:hypothetical protein